MGTSSDGTRVLPFRSALFAVAQLRRDDQPIAVQPVAIAYTRLDGIPPWRVYLSIVLPMLAPTIATVLLLLTTAMSTPALAQAQDAPAEAQRSLHRAAARGDAFGVARALAAEGATVILSGFGDAAAIAALTGELNAIHVPADLSQRSGVEMLMAAAGSLWRELLAAINGKARRCGQGSTQPSQEALPSCGLAHARTTAAHLGFRERMHAREAVRCRQAWSSEPAPMRW